ncbi:hypothetical protein [Microbacterium sp. cx-59]|uniref:hypothetical protein n=1 Tax=Microbacterium sp. cx-59 TaxID=2891207 RepID=UPI001E6207E0|nr:hypothetical protein [Microbacterium sp. cx-59]MCC4908954.1 hypothetical protein [Microbacterium sp. cx-59]
MLDDNLMTRQSDIARLFFGKADGDWDRAIAWYCTVGSTGRTRNLVYRSDGSVDQIRRLAGVLSGPFTSLREAMYQPGRGTWLSAHVEIAPSGSFEFVFNYDARVYLNVGGGDFFTPVPPSHDALTDDEYALDLERFPRDEKFIPDWYPRQVTPPRIGNSTGYFANALNRTVTPMPFEAHLSESSPAWASLIADIHAAVPQQIATLTDEFSAELVDPDLTEAKALWILDGPLQTITNGPLDRHVFNRSLPNLLHLYQTLKSLPIEKQRELEIDELPDYSTVPDTAPGATVRDLYGSNSLVKTGNPDEDDQLDLLLQAVHETAGAIATLDALERFTVTPPRPSTGAADR